MATAEGKTFDFQGEEAIRTEFLETIEYSGLPQEITYETDEFTAVCPFSGLPDIGRVTVQYTPDKKLIELKSLKYYFVSFRNVGIYQEAATDRIYRDIFGCIRPRRLKVMTVYNIRGGIVSTCVMDSDSV
ncbi:MAG: NADPH-dependent 7-cyano-7-deazaguanine reductase QueF [Spirochaetes bacterium]|nr:NADPH-dependent 7-cyano-7-deazaguanine reductase QueF [Spirochaetota bacterium]